MGTSPNNLSRELSVSRSFFRVATTPTTPALCNHARKRHDTTIPTPSITTFNSQGSAQCHRKREDFGYLTAQSNIVLVQETHGAATATHQGEFKATRTNGKYFINNKTSASAGTLIWVGPEMLKTHTVSQQPTSPALQGRAVILLFEPLHGTAGRPFCVVNVYLSAGNAASTRAAELLALLKDTPRAPYHFVAGDFNFVLSAEDTTGTAASPTAKDVTAWLKFAAHFDLREVHQTDHTRFDFPQVGHAPATLRSARLDRIYISNRAAEEALFAARAIRAATPNSMLAIAARWRGGDQVTTDAGDQRLLDTLRRARQLAASDHIPVGLFFLETPTTTPPRTIPRWVCEHALFAPTFNRRWKARAGGDTQTALAALAESTTILHQTAKEVRQALSKTNVQITNHVAESTAAVTILKAFQKRKPDLWTATKVGKRFPALLDKVTLTAANTWDVSGLNGYLEALMAKTYDEAVDAHWEDDFTFLQSRLPAAKGKDFLGFIKAQLPVSRERLLGVWRTEAHLDLETSAHGMAQLAEQYYGALWTAREEEPDQMAIRRYLQQGRSHALCTAPKPTARNLMDTIAGAKHTAAGPDLIPFACYKAITPIMGPILAGVIEEFETGASPPAWFNQGRVILLPKKPGGMVTIDQTRPITIGNVAARLIAKAVQVVLTPHLQANLHESQVGCVPGRSGFTHIEAITEAFYTASEATPPAQCYLLAVDLRKAFDALSETFMHETLRHFGAPAWAQAVVRALHCNVTVILDAGAPPHTPATKVTVTRGIKQGSPLSPMLFTIAMDCILRRLAALGLDVRAFMDDVLLRTSKLGRLIPAMAAIDQFSEYSGLYVNKTKTQLVCTSEATADEDAQWVQERAPWKGLVIAANATYLGILIGRQVTLYDVYEKATAKFTARAHAFSPAIRALPPHKRLAVLHHFLLPVLSYIMMYYPLADWDKEGEGSTATAAAIKNHMSRLFLPFNGTAVPYSSAIADPQDGLAPPRPMVDVWALSLATLAGRLTVDEMRAQAGQRPRPQPTVISMRPSAQKDYGLAQLVAYSLHEKAAGKTPTARAAITAAGFDPTPYALPTAKERRKAAYTLLRRAYQRFLGHDAALRRILGKRLYPNSLPQARATDAQVAANRANCIEIHRSGATAHMKHVYWLFVHNALNTPGRRRGFDHSPATVAQCHFCRGRDTLNTFRHYMGECAVVEAARVKFYTTLRHAEIPWLRPRTQEAKLEAAYLATKASPRLVLSTVAFTYAIWIALTTRWAHEPGGTKEDRSGHIARLAHTHYHRTAPAAWAVPPLSGGGKDDDNRHSESNKARNTRRAIATITPILRQDPRVPRSVLAFTDGSGQTADGEMYAGAGAAVWQPGAQLTATSRGPGRWTEMTRAVGPGTNNIAEMWAVGMIAEHFLRGADRSTIPIIICSDSTLTINILDCDAQPGANIELAHEVRDMIIELRKRRPVRFLWTPGHRGIPGNELADRLADAGARRSIARARPGGPAPPYDRTNDRRTGTYTDARHTTHRQDLGGATGNMPDRAHE